MSKLIGFAAQDAVEKRELRYDHTVLEEFPLFCPKCKYTCVIRFKDGKMEELKMADAKI